MIETSKGMKQGHILSCELFKWRDNNVGQGQIN